MKNKLFSMLVALMLCGCDTEVVFLIKTSDLLGGKEKLLYSLTLFEVPACSKQENKDFDSSIILELKQQVPHYFEGAEYIDCIKQDFDSYARFRIPFALDLAQNKAPYSDKHINIVSNKDAFIAIQIPDGVKSSISKLKANTHSKNGRINFYVKLVVDKGIDSGLRGYHLWVGEKIGDLHPFPYLDLSHNELKPSNNKEIFFKSSQVLIDSALEGNIPVLLYWNK